MDDVLLTVTMRGDKLWVAGDAAALNREFYLPDCNQGQVIEFLLTHVANAAAILDFDRPWRKDTP